MFSDNETDTDLLGFDDQVADICSIVTDSAMLPVTVGLLGDWGSGKTSLLRMAAKRLRAEGALVIEFSPWRIETYDDAKSALLDAVVTAVESIVEPKDEADDVGRMTAAINAAKELRKKIRWMRVAGLAAKHLITMSAPSIDDLDGLLREDVEQPMATTASVAQDFHSEFKSLVDSLDRAVVILVDDLDRCLPEQVLEILQAIRLFLAVPGTAFVLATDERVVRDAVRLRYPQAAMTSETDLPQEYLEKIVQIPIRIPPLGAGQIETYLNLLVAEKHCDDQQLRLLRARAAEGRAQEYLAVAMNLGLARDCLAPDGLPVGAENDFEIVSRTARLLSMALKGNPRQVKRFLNTLFLRRATARRRGLDVDDAVLAKLALLEYSHPKHLQTLHRWQSQADGRPPELRQAELAISGSEIADVLPGVAEWSTNQWLKAWVQMEPPLTDVDLAPYFVLAREALPAGAAISRRLSAALQKVLDDLASPAAGQRNRGSSKAKELEPLELADLLEAAFERLPTIEAPEPLALALLDLVMGREDLVRAVIGAMATLPFQSLGGAFPAKVQVALGSAAEAQLPELLRAWETQGVNATLSKAAFQTRRFLEAGK